MITQEQWISEGWEITKFLNRYKLQQGRDYYVAELSKDLLTLWKRGPSNVLHDCIFVGNIPDLNALRLLQDWLGIKPIQPKNNPLPIREVTERLAVLESERIDGYHWVEYDSCWIIGMWKKYYNGWFLTGDPKVYKDSDFDSIGYRLKPMEI